MSNRVFSSPVSVSIRLLVFLLFLATPWSLFAQSGNVSITGQVINNNTGNFVSGVTVLIQDSELSAVSDVEGRYRITGAPAETVSVQFIKDSYQSVTVTDIELTSGEPYKLDVGMFPDFSGYEELEAFTVSVGDIETTDLVLLQDRQKAASFSNAIGSDSFSKFGAGDAAEALTKVTGVSIADGKYAVIRGLGDRYANTQLNVASLPNPDPDQQTAQLDLFPSSLLESIVTSKTFTPDMPGNTSGGSVNMKTKAFPEYLVFEVSAGVGYNDLDSTQSLFPVDPDIGLSQLADNLGAFPTFNDFSLEDRMDGFIPALNPILGTSELDRSFSIAFGNTYILPNDSELGVTAGLSWDHNFNFEQDRVENRFFFESGAPNLRIRQASTTDIGTEEALIGGQFGLGYKFNKDHQIKFLALHTRSASHLNQISEFFQDRGVDSGFNAGQGDILLRLQSHYTERTLSNVQLSGISSFPQWNDLRMDWVFSTGSSTQDEPDLRGTEVTALRGDRQNLFIAEQFNGRRSFRELQEDRSSLQADFSLPFRFRDSLAESEIKFGFSYIDSENEFRQQELLLIPDLPDSIEGPQLPGFDTPDPIRRVDGLGSLRDVDQFLIVDSLGRTKTSDNPSEFVDFTGFSEDQMEVSAIYLMGDVNISEKWRVIGGLRVEKTEIMVDGGGTILGANPNVFPEELRAGSSSIDETRYLPALSAVYQLQEDMNLRMSVSQTLARPSFRELAPYYIEDAGGGDVYRGNPNGIPDLLNPFNENVLEPLQLSTIRNFDIRWEWFRNETDFFSFSLFYKELENPIEQSNIGVKPGATPANLQPLLISFGNNPNDAEMRGMEAEVRKNLEFVEWLEFWSMGANATYIDAEVAFREDEIALINRLTGSDPTGTRRLQDQPEWIFNGDISYNNTFSGTRATLAFYWISDELRSTAGINTLGTFAESYHTLDFIASQTFGEKARWKLKVSAKNLTDPVRELIMDKDFTQGETLIQTAYRRGRSFSLSFSYAY